MPVKARYENNVLKPIEKLDLSEGEVVEIEIVKSNADRIVGLLKDIDIDSVDLQHDARNIWVRKLVSNFPLCLYASATNRYSLTQPQRHRGIEAITAAWTYPYNSSKSHQAQLELDA